MNHRGRTQHLEVQSVVWQREKWNAASHPQAPPQEIGIFSTHKTALFPNL